jgi:hypothetical protein
MSDLSVAVLGPQASRAAQWVHAVLGDAVEWLSPFSAPGYTPPAIRRAHDYAQIVRIRPDHLLLFGELAISTFLPHTIPEIRGRWFRAHIPNLDYRPWAMATYHPQYVLQHRELESQVLDDLITFKDLPPYIYYPCIKCGGCVGTQISEEGIAWCGNHWDRGMVKMSDRTIADIRRISRQRKKANRGLQGSML